MSNHLVIALLIMSLPLSGYAICVVRDFGVHPGLLWGCWMVVGFVLDFLLGRQHLGKLILLFTLMLGMSGLISAFALFDATSSLFEYLKSLAYLAYFLSLFLAISNLRISTPHTFRLIKISFLVALGVSVYGIYQFLARAYGWPLATLPLNNPSTGPMRTTVFAGYDRPSSFFAEPSWLGAYLADYLVLGVVFLVYKVRLLPNRLTWWICLVVITVAFMLTFSMGAILNVFIALAVIFLIEKRTARLRLLLYGVLALVGILIVNYALGMLFQVDLVSIVFSRLEGIMNYAFFRGSLIEGESLPARLDSMKVAFRIWQDHPIWGVGLGNFGSYSASYNPYHGINPYLTFMYTSSGIMNILSEQGLVGIAAYSMFWGFILWRCWKTSVRAFAAGSPLAPVCRGLFYLVLVDIIMLWNLGGLLDLRLWLNLSLAVLITSTANRVLGKFLRSNKLPQQPTFSALPNETGI